MTDVLEGIVRSVLNGHKGIKTELRWKWNITVPPCNNKNIRKIRRGYGFGGISFRAVQFAVAIACYANEGEVLIHLLSIKDNIIVVFAIRQGVDNFITTHKWVQMGGVSGSNSILGRMELSFGRICLYIRLERLNVRLFEKVDQTC